MRIAILLYCYIDDLCILNRVSITMFLYPQADRTEDNPFWIYLLNIGELKPEMVFQNKEFPHIGTSGHSLNMQLDITNLHTGEYETKKYDFLLTLQQTMQCSKTR
jgi:hypothetical protein